MDVYHQQNRPELTSLFVKIECKKGLSVRSLDSVHFFLRVEVVLVVTVGFIGLGVIEISESE